MSDSTKKSIVINKSFLSGSDNSNSSNINNKKSKKNTRNLSEEIIKPNISPNFICLHSYYTTKNTGINFKKFREIKSSFELGNKNIERSNAEQRNNLYKELMMDTAILFAAPMGLCNDCNTYVFKGHECKQLAIGA